MSDGAYPKMWYQEQADKAAEAMKAGASCPETHIEEVTAELRWSKTGVLQQAWQVRTFWWGTPTKISKDWRDVPQENESAPS